MHLVVGTNHIKQHTSCVHGAQTVSFHLYIYAYDLSKYLDNNAIDLIPYINVSTYAGNMSGKTKGCGPRLQREFPKAAYFWCASHRLNLCIVSSVVERDVRNMMGTCDEVL